MKHIIVWATDGSASADAALPYVQELAHATGARVLVYHGSQLEVGRVGGAYPVHVDEPDLQTKIEGQVEELRRAGVDVTLEVEHAVTDTPDAIAVAASKAGAAYIVVGTRGHGRLAGAMLGSVTQRLLHVATCPVVAVPARIAERKETKEPSQLASA